MVAARALLLLAALPLLAPPVGAQQELIPPVMTLEIAPFSGPVGGSTDAPTAAFTLRVSCAWAAQGGVAPLPVKYAILSQPAWAYVLAPSGDVADAKACAEGYVTLTGELSAFVTGDARAFETGDFVLKATAEGQAGSEEAEATGGIAVAYVGRAAARPDQPVVTLAPLEETDVAFTVDNLGNGRTRIRFEVTTTPGVEAGAIPEITLEPGASGTVHLPLKALDTQEAFRNDTVHLRLLLASSEDPSQAGEEGRGLLGVFVEKPAAPPEPANESPLPGALGVLVALGAAARLRRTR